MTNQSIAYFRMLNQGLLESSFKSVHDLVSYMGCIQSQDYYGAKWAIGNRIKGITDAAIEKDFNDGKILRTHVLRPTWHFVSPEDIRWMLKLTAPKIRMLSKGHHRQFDIDAAVLKRSKKIITKTLEGGKHLTREVLKANLAKGKINTDDIRLGLLLMEAEIDGIICSGKRLGKQFTYALLDERVPATTIIECDEAVAELGKRYFISRGLATVQDFVWWSGLTLKDAKKSIEINKQFLDSRVIQEQTHWFAADMPLKPKALKSVVILPAYDEYTVGYRDRSHVIAPALMKQTGNGIFKPTLLVDGQVSGTWKRTESKSQMQVEITSLVSERKLSQRLLKEAAEAFANFWGKEHKLSII
ncbi:MAG TPA: winged helix DNA-binding domain-containing protein [Cyclobacteriaceae bacterium]